MGWWANLKKRRREKKAEKNEDEYIDISGSSENKLPASRPKEKGGFLSRLRPGARRDRQIAWLQAGYSEMLTLMRGINGHLDRQEDIQHKMVGVLERLPDSMDSLKSVGAAAEQQAEALNLLREQLGNSVKHDQQLVESMNKFNHTLGVMDETTRNSGRTVEQLIEKSRNTELILRDVVERSERRFMLLTILLLLAAAIGIGLVLYSLRPAGEQPTASTTVPAKNPTPELIERNAPAPTVIAPEQKTSGEEEVPVTADVKQDAEATPVTPPPIPADESAAEPERSGNPDGQAPADADADTSAGVDQPQKKTLMQWLFKKNPNEQDPETSAVETPDKEPAAKETPTEDTGAAE